ncbi:glycoside hydrolase family 125 protein [Microbacter margulisiae]|uniref:Glycoside hydrolase family 125 protein n=1 Tax=Microbacter margulisiae TaxID=1350067 RepID=A0A7W5H3B1_9PORP|nr:glycoside hydrolase family 125 protein [Microbacter margulisiae]MBB3188645.1 hypothetical protein [Microbacter margulisiae]
MTTRRDFIRKSGIVLAGVALSRSMMGNTGVLESLSYKTERPPLGKRNFTSKAVEATIEQMKQKIKDPKLAWMFENCYPNTLDTTVEFSMKGGKPDTFVITGDIDAMWLRDSSAQVYPYLSLVNDDPQLSLMIEGVIRRQSYCIGLDPYANAFNKGATGSEWDSDHTKMIPQLHERKWEIDSLCYPIRLAYYYWKKTGNQTIFDQQWKYAMSRVYETFVQQQRKDGTTPYTFTRVTDKQSDTVLNNGYGSPIKPVGMICSTFRPSDDATIFSFLIPSNLFAIESLHQLAEISDKVTGDHSFAQKCRRLASEVKRAVEEYGKKRHPEYGEIYVYEADGFGNQLCMDDANVPGLLSLPYLCPFIPEGDPIYQNTRRFVWSEGNPYYFRGKAGEGIGGPHVGLGWIWPMSLIMRGITSMEKEEVAYSLQSLRDTDAGTGFIHESFWKDDARKYTRKWFAWANTMFGEFILTVDHKYPELLKRSY